MIRFAVIHRARDGLALSASTDLDAGLDLVDSKKSAKLLAKKARELHTKCIMKINQLKIYLLTENDLCCLTICEDSYSSLLAFSFLNDLKNEFLQQYPKQAVDKAVRPYSFIEFDNFIQKTKQKYNNPRSLTIRINLAELTQDLQRDPPYEITNADLTNPTKARSTPIAVQGEKNKLVPLSWQGILACCLMSFCALLNLIRVVPFLSEHGNEPQEEAGWLIFGLSFLFSGLLNGFQCYLLLYPITRRQYFTIGAFILNVLLILFLKDFRNLLQVGFHLGAAIFIFIMTLIRPKQGKLPDYNV
eukprot:gene3465-3962_t